MTFDREFEFLPVKWVPTPRKFTLAEGKVYAQMIEGLSNSEIAIKLSVSVSAVKDHVTNILKKRGVASRAKLIVQHYKGVTIGEVIEVEQ